MPPSKAKAAEPQVTKRKVTMRSIHLGPEGVTLETVRTDYVREDFLESYLTVARTLHQSVEVADGYDAGPGGYEGATFIPATYPVRGTDGSVEQRPFPHPLAGTYYPSFECGPKCKHAPEGAHVEFIAPEGN